MSFKKIPKKDKLKSNSSPKQLARIKSSFFVISFIIKITTGNNERKIKFVYKLVRHMMAQAIKNGVIGTPFFIAGLVKAL